MYLSFSLKYKFFQRLVFFALYSLSLPYAWHAADHPSSMPPLSPAYDLFHLLEPDLGPSGAELSLPVLSCLPCCSPATRAPPSWASEILVATPTESFSSWCHTTYTALLRPAGCFTSLKLELLTCLSLLLPQPRQSFQQDLRAGPASQQSWAFASVFCSL